MASSEVRLSGIIWIMTSCLIFLTGLLNLLLPFGLAAALFGEGAPGVSALLLDLPFGAFFSYVGVRCLRGDTSGNGVASLTYEFLSVMLGLILLGGVTSGDTGLFVSRILGGMSIVGGIGLIVAATLYRKGK